MPVSRSLPQSLYYSGQGQVIFGERDATTGRPISAFAIGNAPALEIQISTTQVDHKESQSGQRATDLTLVTEKSATFNLTIESLNLKNLAAAFYGDVTSEAAGDVTAEPLRRVASDTGLLILMHAQVSDVVLHTTDATPAVVPTSAYFLDSDFGTLQLDLTAQVGGKALSTYTNFTVDYSYEAAERLDALTVVAPPERYVRFQGINTVDDQLCLVTIPRAQFQPLQSLPLINDEVAQVEMTATILPDSLITDGGSRYYRQQYITPSA